MKTELSIPSTQHRLDKLTHPLPSSRRLPPVSLLLFTILLMRVFGASAAVTFSNLHSFVQPFPNGSSPYGSLIQGSDGNLYGTTYYGGTNGDFGTVFQISTNAILNSLYSFTGGNDGSGPFSTLVQATDGTLYGTTRDGGTNGAGTVFQVSTNGTFTNLHGFAGGSDGANPYAGLALGTDGNFYGTTYFGGTNGGYGTVFQITAAGSITTLYSFTGGDDGASPFATMVQGVDGFFYGTTLDGGTNGSGTVFKISTNGLLTTLYSFTGSDDGSEPFAGLVQANDGNFYGTAYYGGAGTNGGTIFRITPAGSFTTLYSFTGGWDGAHPHAALIQGTDGNLYGTTYSGGTYGWGSVFQINTNGSLTSLYSFTGGNDGANPSSSLLQGSDGGFYGTTVNGGQGSAGTVFRVAIAAMAPAFQAVTLSGVTLNLTWSTIAGGMYQLQYALNPDSSQWSNVGSPLTASGTTLTTTDSITNGPQRFYRVVLLP